MTAARAGSRSRSTSGRRRRPRRRPARRRSFTRRWAWRLGGVLVLALTVALLVAYLQVERAFRDRSFTDPSRIYSDALHLSPGTVLPPAVLQAELKARGYRSLAARPSRPGGYLWHGSILDLYRKPFRYLHKSVKALRVRIEFDGEQIDRIRAPSGNLQQLMLEPRILGSFYDDRQESRSWVPLSQIPTRLKEAVVQVEDRRFYAHPGLDLRGLLRATWQDLQAGGIVQGGSTITQQVLKNVLLGRQQRVIRKMEEVVMAPMLEHLLSKNRILEIYLNEIYLGQKGPVSIVGIGAAAHFYFGREARDLDLSQSALLAGLIRSPGRYNPWKRPAVARRRRSEVLALMLKAGRLSPAAARAAGSAPLALADASGGDLPEAAYYLDFLRQKLVGRFGSDNLRRRGLRIFTTVDTRVQKAASQALVRGLDRLESRAGRKSRPLQGAVVVMNPKTGAVLALVGGRDFAGSSFNRALEAHRQVGSLFKPFVYLAAFDAAEEGSRGGLTPASLLMDEPVALSSGGRIWRPANSDGRFRGPVSLRRALADSINVPAVKAALGVGIDRVADLAIACGFPRRMPRVPALALGSAGATPLEVAVAFSTLAGGGLRPLPQAVKWIDEVPGRSLWRQDVDLQRVVSPEAAYLVVDLMREVIKTGTGRQVGAAGLAGQVAGKTGTTNGERDAWFVGFTPDFLAVVWVGADDNKPARVVGSQAALPIWLDLVRRVGAARGRSFHVPAGIVAADIDPQSGELATRRCPERRAELFIWGTEPTEDCPLHRKRGFWRRLFGR